jgi:site-specific recombinase XerD
LIAALKKPVYRGCFTLVYAYGLRIGEARKLPVAAVDSNQSLLRVIGKGNKERAFPLTESILDMLREVWKTHRSQRWLFPASGSPLLFPTPACETLSSKREASAASITNFDRTRFAIASPHTCLSDAWTFASSRFCWDIQVSVPPKSILT